MVFVLLFQSAVSYHLHPNTDAEAQGFFYILPDSGEVILARPLTDSNKTEFRVCPQ